MKRKLFIVAGIAFAGMVAFFLAIFISQWMIKERVPVGLAGSLNVFGQVGYARATGTMVLEGERNFAPLQTTEITCTAHDRQCVVATAMIIPGMFLDLETATYPVIEWTDTQLVFGNEAACVTNTYTLNWVTKSVTGIRVRRKSPEPNVDCSMFLNTELRMTLRSGYDVWQEEERRAYPAFIKIFRAIFY